jgi:hypothetical protein
MADSLLCPRCAGVGFDYTTLPLQVLPYSPVTTADTALGTSARLHWTCIRCLGKGRVSAPEPQEKSDE